MHVSDEEYSKAVRAEIKSRFKDNCRTREGAVVLTYSTDAIKTAQNARCSIADCADWFIKQSETGYAK